MKRIFALLWITALCVGLLLYNISPKPDSPSPDQAPAVQVPSTQEPTAPMDSNEEPEEPAKPATQIRIRNTDPARQQIWEQIAEEYSQKTQVDIFFVEEDHASAPTLYTVSRSEELAGLPVNDLSGTVACAQLADMGLTLTVDGKICGIAAEVECFGLIFNQDKLISAGYTPGDIYDLNSFCTVVQGLGQQGITAFSGRGLDDGVAARLASLPGNIRTLAQLWISYSAKASDGALERFLEGDTVFYLGSTEEYDQITASGIDDLGILPLYLDDQPYQMQSLCVTAKEYWCVRSTDPEEAAAAMAFLDYLVMPDENGQAPVDRLGMLAPYRQASYYSNSLEAVFRQDLTAGKGYLICDNIAQPPEGFIEALTLYAQDPTEENWDKVLQAKSGIGQP